MPHTSRSLRKLCHCREHPGAPLLCRATAIPPLGPRSAHSLGQCSSHVEEMGTHALGGGVGIAISDALEDRGVLGAVGVAGDGAEGAFLEVAPDRLFSAADEVAADADEDFVMGRGGEAVMKADVPLFEFRGRGRVFSVAEDLFQFGEIGAGGGEHDGGHECRGIPTTFRRWVGGSWWDVVVSGVRLVVVLGVVGLVCGVVSAGVFVWWWSWLPGEMVWIGNEWVDESDVVYDGVYEPLEGVPVSSGYEEPPTMRLPDVQWWLYAGLIAGPAIVASVVGMIAARLRWGWSRGGDARS